uniref:DDB1-and CUL4-associated factor 7 n=1 Tax=Parascaris univalens TaxID=6257 RepID=A0A915C559_PARUN
MSSNQMPVSSIPSTMPNVVPTNTGIPRPPGPSSIESAPPPTPTVAPPPAPVPPKRREIYRFTSNRPLFAAAWSCKRHPDKRWRIAVGSVVEEKPQNNRVSVVQLDEQQGELIERFSFEHNFPPNCIEWIPDLKQTSNYSGPLTNFDWNDMDPSLIGTSSIDMSCTIWQLETGQAMAQTKKTTGTVKTQLIAHDKPVHDIAFSKIGNGRDNFA